MYSTKAEELALIDRIVKAGGPEMTIDRAIDLILEQEHERAAATGERVA
jgi:conjugal transfer ATP-binding protein TraC